MCLICGINCQHFGVSVIKTFSQPREGRAETSASDRTMLPDTNFLAEKKLLGDMKSITSLKQSGLSGVFTGQAVSAGSFLSPFLN